MNWIQTLFTQHSVAQTVLVFGLVMAIGTWLGRVKIAGISLGVTWILFTGLLFSYFGIEVNKETEHFLKEFGLILFVYSIGLQVGPGFFASLKKNALANNSVALITVSLGVLLTIVFIGYSGSSASAVIGVMSGAVTNTPGLGAAQTALKDLKPDSTSLSLMTLAYAVSYPFGVFGIIAVLLLLKRIFKIDLENQRELHRKLGVLRSSKPVSIHLNLENRQLEGKPIRRIFELIKEPIVVSRILQEGKIITPTPDTQLHENDVLLVVCSRKLVEPLKLLIGNESNLNLKKETGGDLASRIVVVTRKEVTHKRLGDLPELHQHDFTLTRLNRAGIEMVPHGNTYLQLGDTVKVVGTLEGLETITAVLGNSLKRLDVPDIAPLFMGIVLGVVLGSIPFQVPTIPVAVKIGMAGGPLIIALLLSRFGGHFYLNNYTTLSANLMLRELGIGLFLASVGLGSGQQLGAAFIDGSGLQWLLMGMVITLVPLLIAGWLALKFFKKTYFEVCGLLAGASTDPPALAFALKIAGNEVPSATYATVYPFTMILRIIVAQLLILFFA